MLSPVIYLMMNGLFFTLRLSGGGGSFPRPLKAAEEQKCLEKCVLGDLEARNTLVEHNLRLVAHIVKKYYSQSGDQDDLISIGTIGLIKGISTFKAEKNVRLATYASRCIENAILSQRNAADQTAPFSREKAAGALCRTWMCQKKGNLNAECGAIRHDTAIPLCSAPDHRAEGER
ncbi:MAG: sigma-70 family RNA polymerase sigma factor [Lawsonibacter sp.]|nr:sigma-70 family RNA polymerase sigma factor [Lawsonibacter sp.]